MEPVSVVEMPLRQDQVAVLTLINRGLTVLVFDRHMSRQLVLRHEAKVAAPAVEDVGYLSVLERLDDVGKGGITSFAALVIRHYATGICTTRMLGLEVLRHLGLIDAAAAYVTVLLKKGTLIDKIKIETKYKDISHKK